jgi:hypothetical protein
LCCFRCFFLMFFLHAQHSAPTRSKNRARFKAHHAARDWASFGQEGCKQ